MKQKDSLTYDIFNRYTKVIPDFILTSDRVHKAIYDEMCNINNNFKSLFTDSVLTKAKLAMINTNITHGIIFCSFFNYYIWFSMFISPKP